MDYLTTLSSPVLINGYVHDIIHRRPNAIKELLVKSIEKKNMFILKAVMENAETEHVLSCDLNLLMVAIKNNFPEAMDIFLQNGLANANSVDSAGRTALSVAIQCNSSECCFKLLDAGADPNKGGSCPPPIILAAKSNSTAVIRKLIQMGADINITDEQGRTALFYAAKSAIGVSVLLEAGASTDLPELSSGSTPLMAACVEGFDRVVELMAHKTRNPNIKDQFGHTALTYAAFQGHIAAAKSLLSVGADVSICDEHGMSILALTIHHKQLKMVVTLLQETPLIQPSNRAHLSPLYLAVTNGDFWYAAAFVYAGVDRHYLGEALELLQFSEDQTAWESHPWDKLIQFAQNRPLPLQLLCRNVIRKQIGRNGLRDKVYALELPPCILDFIAMKHLDVFFTYASPDSLLSFII